MIKNVFARDIESGMVAGNLNDNPLAAVKFFEVEIVVLDYPNSKEQPIYVGYTPLINCHAVHTSCRLEEKKKFLQLPII